MTLGESMMLLIICLIILFAGIYIGKENACREETIQATPLLERDMNDGA